MGTTCMKYNTTTQTVNIYYVVKLKLNVATIHNTVELIREGIGTVLKDISNKTIS